MDLYDLEQRWIAGTPQSRAAYDAARQRIPGGVQGNIKFFHPYPLSFAYANGAWLTDVDGHRYVDYLLSFGALLLGHGHPVVRNAMDEVWTRYGTTAFGVPYDLEAAMATVVQDLYPSVEALRFTNSGLEATLLAIRLGLAYTGKTHLAKFDGHYHGGHEYVLVNTEAAAVQGGGRPVAHAESLGLPDYFVDHTVVLPFNNLPLCHEILREHQDEVGVVILEPLQSGFIPPEPGFLQGIRELTRELGLVLIFDEVKTGFRVALGGAQAYYDVRPDLTALGKVLGGGLPIGAVGGRADILNLCGPHSANNQGVFHSGTFNGNPMSLMAGLRTLEFLQQPGTFEGMLDATSKLREGISAIADNHHIRATTMGVGTIFNVLIWDETTGKPSTTLRRALDFALMTHGVFSKPLNRFSVSAAHGPDELRATMDAFDQSFADIASLTVAGTV